VFEITDWDGLPTDEGDPDGLKKNPCWPSMIVPNDPGFALLTNDPYYKMSNPSAAATAADYALPPPLAITSGKTPLWSVPLSPQPLSTRGIGDPTATDTPNKRDLDLVRGIENGTEVEEWIDGKERELVKRGMWVEVVIASPADAEAIPTPVMEAESPVLTLKTVARTRISADLPETTGV
jgi:hypothetical protein